MMLSKHTEKIRKMNLILNYHNKPYLETREAWLLLKKEIKNEVLNTS